MPLMEQEVDRVPLDQAPLLVLFGLPLGGVVEGEHPGPPEQGEHG